MPVKKGGRQGRRRGPLERVEGEETGEENFFNLLGVASLIRKKKLKKKKTAFSADRSCCKTQRRGGKGGCERGASRRVTVYCNHGMS